MTDESIPHALACRYSLARLTDDGALAPYSDEDAPSWENARALRIRTVGEEGPVVLVALMHEDATPEPFHADYAAETVSTPSGDYGLGEFSNAHLRCAANGAIVGTFLDPAWMQIRDARAAGSEPHIADITALVEVIRQGDQLADQVNWRMFDIVISDEKDALTAEEAIARSRFQNDAPLHVVHGLEGLVSLGAEPELAVIDADVVVADEYAHEAKLVLQGWQEVRVFPQYLIDGVRAIFRRFLADRIGDTPIEEIVRIQLGRGEMEAICEVFEQEGFDDMGVSPPFADDLVMRGGYSTSEVRNFRGNGCDIIVFEDFLGAYAYAWPEQLRPALEKNGLRH